MYNLNKLSVIDWIAMILVIVGGLNWGLSIWDINLVEMIFGSIDTWIYALVGLSALWVAWLSPKLSK